MNRHARQPRALTALWILLCCLLTTAAGPLAAEEYMFAYFKGNGEDGLHLAHSTDGVSWKALNQDQSFLAPTVGEDRLMRDPSVVRGPDGVFHMVWTTGWHDRGIGIAHSRDLIHWSGQKRIGVMDQEPGCRNCWAPEIFYDAGEGQYLIFWASTIEGRFPETQGRCDNGLNHRIYCTTTKDFETYSATRLFFDPGFPVIDSFLVRHADSYVLVSKDETRYPEPHKNLFAARAAEAGGPYTQAGTPFSPDWVEGPSVLRVADRWIVYYDEYTRHHYGAMQTRDFKTWQALQTPLTHPEGMRHGTAFAVPETIAAALLAYGNGDTHPDLKATIRIETGEKSIGNDLFGIFFEDINYAADGGLYAELVQNRSFEYSREDNRAWDGLTAWELVQRGGAQAEVNIKAEAPLHPNNPHYAELRVTTPGEGAGLINSGFDGIVLAAGDTYKVSLFARVVSGEPGAVTVRLESGGGTLGELRFEGLDGEWRQYAGELVARANAEDAQLSVNVSQPGTIALDIVSLFPEKTFHNRPNGLRRDLAQVIADLKPKFVRFPGGCLAHGDGLENMYRWKDTIGPVEERKAQRNIWRYHQTVGLGYFEYFQFCEDIGAKPLPVVPAGVCCQNSGNYLNLVPRGQQGIPMPEMPDYVQEVLDLIEYANGPATSTWGAKRAAAGHPAPFGLEYLGVGNEDKITPEFKIRFKMINDAVKKFHPEITVVGTTGPATDGQDYEEGWKFARELGVDMVDEHGYKAPMWFWRNLKRFDAYERGGPLVYLGEYAAHEPNRANTLHSALAEGAYMTSLERNGDLVRLSSYAPLLSKQGHTQWRPDMIYFDNTRITPSLNYYVQQLFSVNHGDTYLPTKVEMDNVDTEPPRAAADGVLLGTWQTQARFKDVQILQNNGETVACAIGEQNSGWKTLSGDWRVESGGFLQSSNATPALVRFGFAGAPDGYTFKVRAMKTGGNEGFLIGFRAVDTDNYFWWNLGGWGNTRHAVEQAFDGSRGVTGPSVPGAIESNRWYNIEVRISDSRIQCYLDGALVEELQQQPYAAAPLMTASCVRDSKSGDTILKIVSRASEPIRAALDLGAAGRFAAKADCTVLQGAPLAENRFGERPEVLPESNEIQVSPEMVYEIPACSLSVIRLHPAK